jgi:predicted transcriptional regulator
MWTDRDTIVIPHFLIVLREIAIKPQSVTDLFEATKITYSHIHSMKGVFLDKGWVTAHKEDKKIILTTTDKGKAIVAITVKLLDAMDVTIEDIRIYLEESKLHRKGKTDENRENI